VFGSIGGSEVLLLFVVALLLFGPRRLPEIGRMLGKAVADFRRATNEFKMNLEREVQLEDLKAAIKPIENAPHPAALARGVLLDAPPVAPAAATETEAPEHPEKKNVIDGGPSSIH
jgi:Tat protein translocase TatB subunit